MKLMLAQSTTKQCIKYDEEENDISSELSCSVVKPEAHVCFLVL